MKLRNQLLIISTLIIFSCQNENRANECSISKIQLSNTFEINSHKPKVENQIDGKYFYTLGWSYSEILEIKKDGTFSFLSQGCRGRDSTNGTWKQFEDKISLTSFPEFKYIPKYGTRPSTLDESEKKIKIQSNLDTSLYLEIVKLEGDFKYNPEIYIENWELVIGDNQLTEISKEETKENRIYEKNKK